MRWVIQMMYRRRRYVLVTILAYAVLWVTGLLDHVSETSFDYFDWPTGGVDVYRETISLVGGGKPQVRPEFDWNSAKPDVLPKCTFSKEESNKKVLIVVKSSVYNTRQRDAVRSTWGLSTVVGGYRFRTIFVVGRFQSQWEQQKMGMALEREAEKYSDLLVMNAVDSYRNNTKKFITSIGYAYSSYERCEQPDFILLIDDDYLLSTHNLISLLHNRDPLQHVYEGFRFDTSPFRFRLHKHQVSLRDYPFDAYPPYISAGAVLLSKQTLEFFYYAITLTKPYSFDDIYAGIVAYRLNIRPQHNEAFVFWKRQISHQEWMDHKVICAHGFDANTLEEQYPVVRFTTSG